MGSRAVRARNATTHGLFARDVVLPTFGEDPAAFDALLAQLCAQLPPRNLLERHYVEQIAAASWRLRRLHRWQSQVYEDPALTEDARLDKLDKTLRQENTLTRQIDRAVHLLGRDLSDLFTSRARDAALRDFEVTEAECRQDPHLAADIQRRVWDSFDDAGADPDLTNTHLDNTFRASPDAPPKPQPVSLDHPPCQAPLPFRGGERSLSAGGGTPTLPALDTQICENEQKCENELPPLSVGAIVAENLRNRIPPAGWGPAPASVNLVHGATQAPSPALADPEGFRGGEGEPQRAGGKATAWDEADLDEDDPDYVDEYGFGKGERPPDAKLPDADKKCENENCENETGEQEAPDGAGPDTGGAASAAAAGGPYRPDR